MCHYEHSQNSLSVRYLVVCGRSAHVPMSLRARTSVLDTCTVENVMDSCAARDSVENGSDSSGNGTSDSGAVSTLIILRLLYPDSCSKWFFLVLLRGAFVYSVLPPSLIVGLRSGSRVCLCEVVFRSCKSESTIDCV